MAKTTRKPMGIKQMEIQLARLKEIRRIATMENAGFSGIAGRPSTEEIKKATHHWRQSWIIQPLDDIIAEYETLLRVSNV